MNAPVRRSTPLGSAGSPPPNDSSDVCPIDLYAFGGLFLADDRSPGITGATIQANAGHVAASHDLMGLRESGPGPRPRQGHEDRRSEARVRPDASA
ncbi:MAG: hypothetical protein IPK67_16400 [Planctomycetes bacterium]|nr:hypothetical protein [Planctomycetota bacterium]